MAATQFVASSRVRTLEDLRRFPLGGVDQLPDGLEPWALPVYGANSTLRINKASLKLRTNRMFDGTVQWQQMVAAFVPVWKSGSTTLIMQMDQQAGFQHNAHSFAGRVGTAAITNATVVLAAVADPIERFESAFRSLNSVHLTTPDVALHRQRLAAFVDAVWHGYPVTAGEHVLTQMYFLTSTDRHGTPLAFTHIGKIEELEETMGAFETALSLSPGTFNRRAHNCTLGCHVAKHALLRSSPPELLRRVCALYRQDFMCLGYRMPDACQGSPLPVPPYADHTHRSPTPQAHVGAQWQRHVIA